MGVVRHLLNVGYYQGHVAELIVYNRVLSVQERTAVNQYLSTKYAIALA